MIKREPFNAALDHPDYFEDLGWLDDQAEEEPVDLMSADIISTPAAVVFMLVLLI